MGSVAVGRLGATPMGQENCGPGPHAQSQPISAWHLWPQAALWGNPNLGQNSSQHSRCQEQQAKLQPVNEGCEAAWGCRGSTPSAAVPSGRLVGQGGMLLLPSWLCPGHSQGMGIAKACFIGC